MATAIDLFAPHVCQDLHQACWDQAPGYDILLASPCCQSLSKARGQASGNPQRDSSRSTVWAVVSALRSKLCLGQRPPLASGIGESLRPGSTLECSLILPNA